MKAKTNAKQRREAEEQRRKGAFSPKTAAPVQESPPKPAPSKPKQIPVDQIPTQSPEEGALEFLAYLDRHGVPAQKEDFPQPKKKKPSSSNSIPRVNLEEGMPLVEEALSRMNLGLQEMRVGRVKAVKLIHGYGSTGRGGKIRDGVRNELAAMKKRKQIKDYIPGEDFGPTDPATRKLADQNTAVTRDPDYGRMNHGITVVIL